MVFITEGFFEVAIESWPEWDLNPRPLNSVQMLQPTELSGHELNSHSEATLYSYSNFIVCSVSHFISAIAFVSRHVCFHRIFEYIYIDIYMHWAFSLPSKTRALPLFCQATHKSENCQSPSPLLSHPL